MSSEPVGPHLSPEELAKDQSGGLRALFIVFTILPTIATTLRIITRRLTEAKLWWDDYLSLAATLLCWVQFAFLEEAIKYGLGRHVLALPPTYVKPYLMYTYLSELYYATAVSFIKISILCLYLRIFSIDATLRKLCYVMIGFVTVWGVAVLFTTIFQCTPVRAAWDKSITTAHCFVLNDFVIGSNVPNIIADFLIIMLPIPRLWTLQLSTMKRLGMIALFFFAGVTTVVSIVRCVLNARINVMDPTWSFVNVAIFSTVEVSVGVCCASMPAIYPLFRLLRGRSILSSTGRGSRNTKEFNSSSSRGRVKLGSNGKEDDSETLWTPSTGDATSGSPLQDPFHNLHMKDGQIPMDRIIVTRDMSVEVEQGKPMTR